MKIRDNSYHWVKYFGTWIVAKWQNYNRSWIICDDNFRHDDTDFEFIDETEIPEPK